MDAVPAARAVGAVMVLAEDEARARQRKRRPRHPKLRQSRGRSKRPRSQNLKVLSKLIWNLPPKNNPFRKRQISRKTNRLPQSQVMRRLDTTAESNRSAVTLNSALSISNNRSAALMPQWSARPLTRSIRSLPRSQKR